MKLRRTLAMITFFVMLLTIPGIDFDTLLPRTLAEEVVSSSVIPELIKAGVFDQSELSGQMTWSKGAKLLCAALGIIREDAQDADMNEARMHFTHISAEDDSVYLCILWSNGYLPKGDPIDPDAPMSSGDREALFGRAFAHILRSQEEAKDLDASAIIDSLAVGGGDIQLAALEAGRIAFGTNRRVSLSGVKAVSAALMDTDAVLLKASELERLMIDRAAGDVSVHIDAQSRLSEIIIERAREVTVEGNGALGMVRITGEADHVTVRATAAVVNQTGRDITVKGPDGQLRSLMPGSMADFVLTDYLITFITEGSPVESRRASPGEVIDFSNIATRKDGAVFTSWYEDENYTHPFSTLTPVDRELLLYARFVDDAEALTVHFDAMGGRALQPLAFAAGETLLSKPISSVYTDKEGFSFNGWCLDAESTLPFGYTDPIKESMTLYAMFVSAEAVEEEQASNAAQLDDMDWQGEIGLVADEGISLDDLPAMLNVREAASGGETPLLSFREDENGFVVYGDYYEINGQKGFEPGATFVLAAEEGISFRDYDSGVRELAVAVFREESELVSFKGEISYLLWDDVLSYESVKSTPDTGEETEIIPGTLVIKGMHAYQTGDIITVYDGEINKDEAPVSFWTEGSFEGYVLFAQVLSCKQEGDRITVIFGHARPEDYIAELDVHTRRDVDIEQELDRGRLLRLEKEVASQIASNEELRAQMLVAVMTSAKTQEEIDAIHGPGVYSLAGISASMEMSKPKVSLSVSGNTVTAGISIKATVTLESDGETILTVTPELSFTESLSVEATIDGGKLWVDAAARLTSTTRVSLTITANTGSDEDAGILSEAKATFEKIITPEGLDDTGDYVSSINELMDTMKSLVSTNLPYTELFNITLLTLRVTFYGIAGLGVKINLLGEIGVLATFGIEIVVKQGERIGFNYNFLKLSGGSYAQKLANSVNTNIYLIGKIGARIGLQLTLTIDLLAVAQVSIIGTIYAYAELTGMLFYTASLLTGSSTAVGGVYFEVGIDASIALRLQVDLLVKKVEKTWTLWEDRFPLWSMSRSSAIIFMDIETLDSMWKTMADTASQRTVYGFQVVPMNNYDLFNGRGVSTQVPFGTDFALSIENMVVDGEAVPPGDQRYTLMVPGDGSGGRSRGFVYFDEKLAAKLQNEWISCDVVLTYQNPDSKALIKKQSHRFSLTRQCWFATTTVDIEINLVDWCAKQWGIESASWDQRTLYQTTIVSSHTRGFLFAPTQTIDPGLPELLAGVRSAYPELEGAELGWFPRTSSGVAGEMQYSTPHTSNTCFLSPQAGIIRYDISPDTVSYTLRFNLYAFRFPGYSGRVIYRLSLSAPEDTDYSFSVEGWPGRPEMTFSPEEGMTWVLDARRRDFDGIARPLIMKVGGQPVETGQFMTGREPEEVVRFSVKGGGCLLNLKAGTGIRDFRPEDPALDISSGLRPGTQIDLIVDYEDGYRRAELVTDAKGLRYTSEGERLSFTMPAYDLRGTIEAQEAFRVDYDYHHGQLGLYLTAYAAKDEPLEAPDDPVISGLTFRAWYDREDCEGLPYAFGQTIDQDIRLYADWTCDVTVDFGGAAGEAAYAGADGMPVKILEGSHARFTYSSLRVGEAPYDVIVPYFDGHEFMGWYLNPDFGGEAVEMGARTLTGGISFYARWVKILLIGYSWNHGQQGLYSEMPALAGLPIEMIPEDPELEGYTFTGWYTHPGCAPETVFDLRTGLTVRDITLYAGWSPIEYAITYDLAGGEAGGDNPSIYTIENESITLKSPTRPGYSFIGWTGTGIDNITREVVIPGGSVSGRSYTAHWEIVMYSLSYDLNHGVYTEDGLPADNPNPTEYTIESPDITLQNPERARYTFIGWSGTGLSGNVKEAVIKSGSTGNRAYTANWVTEDEDAEILRQALSTLTEAYRYDLDDYEDGQWDEEDLLRDVLAGLDAYEEFAPLRELVMLSVQRLDPEIEEDWGYELRYRIEARFTPQSGKPKELIEGSDVIVYVYKRAVTITEAPVASDLLRGQMLSQSVLTGGCAVRAGQEAGESKEEVTLEGSFEWYWDGRGANPLTMVPSSADNGDKIYRVIFKPELSDLYATAEINVSLRMQIGVKVSVTAEDRLYRPDDLSATGTYTLRDIDADTALESALLTGGNWRFAQSAPNMERDSENKVIIGQGNIPLYKPIEVTFSGYALNTGAGEESLYALFNETATTEACIRQQNLYEMGDLPTITAQYWRIEQSEFNVPQPIGIQMAEFSMRAAGRAVQGSWRWADIDAVNALLPDDHSAVPVLFEPGDDGYAVYRGCVHLQLAKYDPIPVELIVIHYYDGNRHFSPYSNETIYYDVEDNGIINAGKASAILTIKKDLQDRVAWGTGNPIVRTINYQINPALISTDNNVPSVLNISYGQELNDNIENEAGITRYIKAGDVIQSSVKLTGSEATVDGAWVWQLDPGMVQPLSVQPDNYQIKAVFIPQNGAENYDPNPLIKTVPVKVNPVIPDISGVSLSVTGLYPNQSIEKSAITAEGDAFNPISGANVQGSWQWDTVDGQGTYPIYDENSPDYMAVFVPDKGIAVNYIGVSLKKTIQRRTDRIIQIEEYRGIPEDPYNFTGAPWGIAGGVSLANQRENIFKNNQRWNNDRIYEFAAALSAGVYLETGWVLLVYQIELFIGTVHICTLTPGNDWTSWTISHTGAIPVDSYTAKANSGNGISVGANIKVKDMADMVDPNTLVPLPIRLRFSVQAFNVHSTTGNQKLNGMSPALLMSSTIETPVPETSPSAAATEPPAAATEPPASATEPPASGTEPPASGTEPPASGTEPPASGTEAPASGTEAPASGTEAPALGTEPPASGTEAPASGTEVPASGTNIPAPGMEMPAPTTEPPISGMDTSPPTTEPPASGTDTPIPTTEPSAPAMDSPCPEPGEGTHGSQSSEPISMESEGG